MKKFSDISWGQSIEPGQTIRLSEETGEFEGFYPNASYVTVSNDGRGDFQGDTNAVIELAIAKAVATGAEVFIFSGTYNFSRAILLTEDNIKINCAPGVNLIFGPTLDIDTTKIEGNDSTLCPMFYGNGIKGFRFYGNGATINARNSTLATDPVTFELNCFVFKNTEDCVLSDINFLDYYCAIWNIDSIRNKFFNLKGSNCTATLFVDEGSSFTICDGLYQEGGVEILDSNAFNSFCTYRNISGKNVTEGIDIDRSSDILLDGVLFDGGGIGITINSSCGTRHTAKTTSTADSNNITVRGVKGTVSGNGIQLKVNDDRYVKNLTLEDIAFTNLGGLGITVTQANTTQLNLYEGLFIKNFKINGGAMNGISLAPTLYSDNVTLENVYIDGLTGRGLSIGGSNIHLKNITISNCTGGGLNVSSGKDVDISGTLIGNGLYGLRLFAGEVINFEGVLKENYKSVIIDGGQMININGSLLGATTNHFDFLNMPELVKINYQFISTSGEDFSIGQVKYLSINSPYYNIEVGDSFISGEYLPSASYGVKDVFVNNTDYEGVIGLRQSNKKIKLISKGWEGRFLFDDSNGIRIEKGGNIEYSTASSMGQEMRSCVLSPDGTIVFFVLSTSLYRGVLSTPFDMSTISNITSLNLAGYTATASLRAVCFAEGGASILVVGYNGAAGKIFAFSLTAAYTLSIESTVGTIVLPYGFFGIAGLLISSDNQKIHLLNGFNVYCISLSAPFNFSSPSAPELIYQPQDFGAESIISIAHNTDKTKVMFVLGLDRSGIHSREMYIFDLTESGLLSEIQSINSGGWYFGNESFSSAVQTFSNDRIIEITMDVGMGNSNVGDMSYTVNSLGYSKISYM